MFLRAYNHTSVGLLADLKKNVRADINKKPRIYVRKLIVLDNGPSVSVVETGATRSAVEAWQVTVASSVLPTNLYEEEAALLS